MFGVNAATKVGQYWAAAEACLCGHKKQAWRKTEWDTRPLQRKLHEQILDEAKEMTVKSVSSEPINRCKSQIFNCKTQI